MSQSTPTDKEADIYCREWIRNGWNQTAAWKVTYPRSGASDKTANEKAVRYHASDKVKARLEKIQNDIAEQSKAVFSIEVEDVLRELVSVAMADPKELTQYRRGACRHCYGFDNEYHWKDPHEFQRSKIDGKDDFGGYGYRHTQKPADDCPRCEGLGEPYVWIADTRDLSPQAARLFSGVKTTQHGTEIRLRDQDAALVNLGKYLGMFTDNVNLRSPDGSMTPTVIERTIVDPKA